jgi:hypothetical protein
MPVLEARLRYAAAAPLIGDAAQWADLGAGNGSAGAAVAAPGDVLLVDADARALAVAVAADGPRPGAATLALDLAAPADVRRLLGAVAPGATVTCFGVLERLSGVVALLDALGTLAASTARPSCSASRRRARRHAGRAGRLGRERVRGAAPASCPASPSSRGRSRSPGRSSCRRTPPPRRSRWGRSTRPATTARPRCSPRSGPARARSLPAGGAEPVDLVPSAATAARWRPTWPG